MRSRSFTASSGPAKPWPYMWIRSRRNRKPLLSLEIRTPHSSPKQAAGRGALDDVVVAHVARPFALCHTTVGVIERCADLIAPPGRVPDRAAFVAIR
jgi:hypothetical protein